MSSGNNSEFGVKFQNKEGYSATFRGDGTVELGLPPSKEEVATHNRKVAIGTICMFAIASIAACFALWYTGIVTQPFFVNPAFIAGFTLSFLVISAIAYAIITRKKEEIQEGASSASSSATASASTPSTTNAVPSKDKKIPSHTPVFPKNPGGMHVSAPSGSSASASSSSSSSSAGISVASGVHPSHASDAAVALELEAAEKRLEKAREKNFLANYAPKTKSTGDHQADAQAKLVAELKEKLSHQKKIGAENEPTDAELKVMLRQTTKEELQAAEAALKELRQKYFPSVGNLKDKWEHQK